MSLRGLGLAFVGLCACMVEVAPRPRPPAPPSRTTQTDLTIRSETLASGLRVVFVTDPAATEVQVTTRYAVGALDDGAKPGVAHFVEHLMFQQALAGQPLFTQLEDIATYFNAETTFETTTYVARAPASALRTLITFEATRLQDRCKTISDAAFTREREVVVNEIQQRDDATTLYTALHRGLYPQGHPYRAAVGGTVDTVRAITRSDACSFADTYYGPSNAVLVVSGHLSTADIAATRDALARVTARSVTAPTRTKLPAPTRQHLELPAPVDEDILVVMWPLPADPELRTKLRAIMTVLPKLVDEQIEGDAVGIELGDDGAPLVGFAMLPGDNETVKQVIDRARIGVAKLPHTFDANPDSLDELVFDRIKQGAIYGHYALLEDGSGRDARLATAVAHGRDPNAALDSELATLDELTREEATDLAEKYFAPDTPTVVTLKPNQGKRRGEKVRLSTPIHDLGRRRTTPDAALASQPAAGAPGDLATGARTRVLANGLRVVLLPVTAVPTFEARLIFQAGTADEPFDQRGVALLAANTLTWDLHHIPDAVAFIRAGGSRNADVTSDRTTFSIQGLETNLDVLLAGLRRWVRDGVYDDSAASFVTSMRRAAKRSDDQGPLTDAWRASLYGANNPYFAGGLVRYMNPALTLQQAAQFRNAFFMPDNATLVIAGRFDPKLADEWIDFLFGDWGGHALPRQRYAATTLPSTIAKADDTTLAQVRIAIPVATTPEQRIVAASMLSDLARDVRYQLGASYTFDAGLAETPVASFIVLGGWVDASRATSALQLIRDRVGELKRDSTAAARAFVVARTHVLTQLQSRVGSASALASRIEHDVELRRDPLSDLALARSVRTLTIGQMTDVLGQLDLARATVLVDGPERDVSDALAVLGRKTSFLPAAPPAVTPPGVTTVPASFAEAEQHVYKSEIEPALTEQPEPRRLLELTAHIAAASTEELDGAMTGLSLTGDVGYRYGWHNAVGLRLEIARLSADEYTMTGVPVTKRLMPIAAMAVWHLAGAKTTWGDVSFGVHGEELAAGWKPAALYGIQGGLDLIRHHGHRVGVSARWEATISSFDYSALSIGLAYRQ